MYCQACGATNVATKQVTFSQNIGALVLRFSRTVSGNLCRNCIDQNFFKMTFITATLGWWGIISFFTTLFIIPSNIVNYVGALSLPRGPANTLGPGQR
jgi:hypothetical protein